MNSKKVKWIDHVAFLITKIAGVLLEITVRLGNLYLLDLVTVQLIYIDLVTAFRLVHCKICIMQAGIMLQFIPA